MKGYCYKDVKCYQIEPTRWRLICEDGIAVDLIAEGGLQEIFGRIDIWKERGLI